MKNLETFKIETKTYTSLEDFVLSTKEWCVYRKGTESIRVKTYNSAGNLVNKEYVLKGLDNTDEILEDMQYVGSGYYTETQKVIHN